MSSGFHRSLTARRRKLTKISRTKGIYQVRFQPRCFFDFAEYLENSTYGQGYILTSERNSDNDASSHRPVVGADDALKRSSNEAVEKNSKKS